MTLPVFDRDNQWIDGLRALAEVHQGNHSLEALFVPTHDQSQDLLDDTESEDELEANIDEFQLGNGSQSVIDWSGFNEPQVSAEEEILTQSQVSTTDGVIAIDAGIIDLGELASGGVAFAVRGAAVCYPPNNAQPFVCRYNTGALVVDQQNQLQLFHYMGHRLGQSNLFVNLSPTGGYAAKSSGMSDTPNKIRDRFRNFVERIIQEEAVAILESYGGGILLIDGALSAGTFDTPEPYVRQLLSNARNRGINVAAVSKKTRITVSGRPISSLFAEQPGFVGYAPLTQALQQERQAASANGQTVRSVAAISVADQIFAVRFSYAPPALTFRADVHPALGLLPGEVLDRVYNRCQIYGGYPRPLIECHQYSSFMYQDVQSLLVDIVVRLGVRPQEEPSMEVLFQPFGARFK
jgi:hypothetical protein